MHKRSLATAVLCGGLRVAAAHSATNCTAAAAARGAEDRSSVGSAAMDDVVDLGQWLRDPAGGGRSGTPNTPKEARGGDKWAAMSVRELKSELKARGISQEGAAGGGRGEAQLAALGGAEREARGGGRE